MIRVKTYWRVWQITAQNALQMAFVNRWSNSLFLLGKFIRLVMSLVFLYLLKEREIAVGGYTANQVIVFLLTYQLVDLTAQIFYRGVYEFGRLIQRGEFDFLLARPINPLFRALTGSPDFNDVLFLVPTAIVSTIIIRGLELAITPWSVMLYLLLLINSFVIATSLHILILTFGVITSEVDNLIWTYRDVTKLGQFPVSMYVEPVRTALFFVIPIGLMVTVPSQVLFGEEPSVSVIGSTLFGMFFFWVSLKLWKQALKKYSSASS